MITGGSNKVIVTLLCVFVAGAASGALGMRLALRERLRRTPSIAQVRSSQQPANAREALLARYQAELHLTDEQTQMMRLVLEDYWRYYVNLQDQLDDMRATGKGRIEELLDDQQRQQFERLSGELQGLPAGAK